LTKLAKLSEKILSVLLIIFIFSEIFLLNQNFALKKKVSSYQLLEELLSQYQAREESNIFSKIPEGKCLPFFLHQQLHNRANRMPDVKELRFTVIFCFTLKDCGSCLVNEISTWNKFHKAHVSEICKVIGLTDTTGYGNLKSISRSLNIHFPLAHVADMKNQLNKLGSTSTPITFFVDLTMNKIIYANASLPYNESGSEEFSKKLQMMLDECE